MSHFANGRFNASHICSIVRVIERIFGHDELLDMASSEIYAIICSNFHCPMDRIGSPVATYPYHGSAIAHHRLNRP